MRKVSKYVLSLSLIPKIYLSTDKQLRDLVHGHSLGGYVEAHLDESDSNLNLWFEKNYKNLRRVESFFILVDVNIFDKSEMDKLDSDSESSEKPIWLINSDGSSDMEVARKSIKKLLEIPKGHRVQFRNSNIAWKAIGILAFDYNMNGDDFIVNFDNLTIELVAEIEQGGIEKKIDADALREIRVAVEDRVKSGYDKVIFDLREALKYHKEQSYIKDQNLNVLQEKSKEQNMKIYNSECNLRESRKLAKNLWFVSVVMLLIILFLMFK